MQLGPISVIGRIAHYTENENQASWIKNGCEVAIVDVFRFLGILGLLQQMEF